MFKTMTLRQSVCLTTFLKLNEKLFAMTVGMTCWNDPQSLMLWVVRTVLKGMGKKLERKHSWTKWTL